MRISDWSSDVCSSDLSENFKRVRLSVGPELAIFGRIDFPAKQGGFHDGFPGPDRPKGLPGKADGVQGGKAIGEKWQAYRLILEPPGRFIRKGQAGSAYRIAELLPCAQSGLAAFEEDQNEALGLTIRHQGAIEVRIEEMIFQEC